MSIDAYGDVDDVEPDGVSRDPEESESIPYRSQRESAERTLSHVSCSGIDESEAGAEIGSYDEGS